MAKSTDDHRSGCQCADCCMPYQGDIGSVLSPPAAPGHTDLMIAPEEINAFLENDAIDHPPHYSRWVMEPIEFIAINDLPWWLANVIKYTMRYDAKDGLKDLYKARSYLDMKIRQLEGHKRFWEKPVSEERRLNKAA